MAIHLVGETIDARQANQRAQAGELVKVMRGIYVDQDVDCEAAILGLAIRIVHYLYPNANLPGCRCSGTETEIFREQS